MYKNIPTQSIGKLLRKSTDLQIDLLRCDLLHPVISGNKIFKLKYYLEDAINQHKEGIVTFGGPYSNHLVAMAAACHEQNLASVGIVRGEQINNHSTAQMRSYGMTLLFVTRQEYDRKDILKETFLSEHPGYFYVPEGGQGNSGIRGAAEILSPTHHDHTHIICAVGTGTTLAGLINASQNNQQILGIPVLKISNVTNNELEVFLQANTNKKNYKILYGYHQGGYAKKTKELLAFMNDFYRDTQVPTDFVYTAKMIWAVRDLIENKFFSASDKLLLIHTGGLQGNSSLPAGSLIF